MPQYFDSTPCPGATLDDINPDQVRWFVTTACRASAFSIPKDAPPRDVLQRLGLLRQDQLTNAAVMLFGRDPQRLLKFPPIKCRQFRGATTATPVINRHACDKTIFEWIYQASFFILKGVARADPSRWELPPYDIPQEAAQEAVLNALVHQDYSGSAGMQVTLYSDRLEISNPGALPPSLALDQLRQPHASVPGNPLLAQALQLTKSMEGKGEGTLRMIELCRKAGLPEPQFKLTDSGFLVILGRRPQQSPAPADGETGGQAAPQADPRVMALVRLLEKAPLGTTDILKGLQLKDRNHLRERYLDPALQAGLIELTLPDRPNSRLQQYRLTAKGKALL